MLPTIPSSWVRYPKEMVLITYGNGQVLQETIVFGQLSFECIESNATRISI